MEKTTKMEFVSISKLKPYENNARTHSEEQIQKIVNSLTEFGFVNPVIIDENNMILVGHGRTEAAKRLGIDKVPCVRVSYLSEKEKRAYILADNLLSDMAGWDREMMLAELSRISDIDMTLFGFEDINIPEDQQPKAEKEKVVCPKCGYEWEG